MPRADQNSLCCLQGIDVPAANVVITYNHMKDSVELCQREGRARQADCVFVVMEQRRDRPVARLRQVQTSQEHIIRNFNPVSVTLKTAAMMQSQSDRQRHANRWLLEQPCNRSDWQAALNFYRQKTKGNVEESLLISDAGSRSVKLTYTNPTFSMEAEGTGFTKKAAKYQAAHKLVLMLREKALKDNH